MKKIITMIVILWGLFFTVSAGNSLLGNPQWNPSTDGQIPYWSIYTQGGTIANKDGVVTFSVTASDGFCYVSQSGLRLEKKLTYLAECEVRSTTSSQYMFYGGWTNALGKYQEINLKPGQGSAEWVRTSFTFTIADDAKNPYLALRAASLGTVSFRNVRLTQQEAKLVIAGQQTADIAPSTASVGKSLLENPQWNHSADGQIPYWSTYAQGGTIANKDGVVTFSVSANDGFCYVSQSGLRLEKKAKYLAECEVRSTTNSQYMFYGGWTNTGGKYQEINLEPVQGSAEWVRTSFTFTIADDAKNPYLALRAASPGTVSFRNVRLTKQETKSVIGGQWTGDITPSGELCYRGTDTAWPLASISDVPVRKGQLYELSFQIKGSGDSGNTTGFHYIRVTATFLGSEMTADSNWDDVLNNDTYHTKILRFAVPKELAEDKVSFQFYANTKGTLFLKNMTLKAVQPNPTELYTWNLVSPAYRDSFYASSRENTLKGTIVAPEPSRSVQLRIIHSDGSTVTQADAKVDNGKIAFDFDVTTWPTGQYALELVDNAKVVKRFTFVKYAPATNEVVLDANRQVLINGKRFFVNFLWWVPGNAWDPAPLKIAAANGVTATMIFPRRPEDTLRELDYCLDAGLKAVIYLSYLSGTNDYPTIAHIDKLLDSRIISHPALLAYSMTDEPELRGVPLKDLMASYEHLKTKDPFHPVWINAAPRGNVTLHAAYSHAADIYGLDIYPVPQGNGHSALEDQSLACVGKYTQMMVNSVANTKPIWMVLQAFPWGGVTGKPPIIHPTRHELRFIAYDAMNHGSRAICWWGMQYIKDPNFYDELFAVVREIHELSGLLVEVDWRSASMNNGVNIRHLHLNNADFVIAVNTLATATTATISGTFNHATLTVYGENRRVMPVDNSFVDQFAPFSVHIYLDGALPAPNTSLPENSAAIRDDLRLFKEFKLK